MRHAWQPAPRAEWVEMYRKGLTGARIARLVDAPASTVRYHLQVAVRANPRVREEHQAALVITANGCRSRGCGTLPTSLPSTRPRAGCP